MNTQLPYLEKVQKKLKFWKVKLQDVGGGNRLLFFKETKSSTVVIEEPDIHVLFNRLVVDAKPLYAPLPPKEERESEAQDEKDQRDSETITSSTDFMLPFRLGENEFLSNKSLKELNRALQNLRYSARTIREEQGFNALYLTFGFLHWQEGGLGEFYEAPLLLVPVDIKREARGDRWSLELFEDEIVVNPTLQTKLNEDFGISLPENLRELSVTDLDQFWDSVNDIVKNLNGWKVKPTAAIAVFNFQTLLIIKDIEKNIELFQNHDILAALSGVIKKLNLQVGDVPAASELDEKVNPSEIFQILDADSSQQEAIEAAKKGLSFIIQGPPGTGKSQTIANIIAEFLATGKKVLFVSQKAVALDVVNERLSKSGLGDYCLEVHNYKKKKGDVIKELGKSLSIERVTSSADNESKKRELKQLRNDLNSYPKELHKPHYAFRHSLYQITGNLAKLDVSNLQFSIADLENLTREDISAESQRVQRTDC